MRAMLLGLVLANALYWGWSRWIDPASMPSISSRNAIDVPTLQLVTESELAGTAVDASVARNQDELDVSTIEPLILGHLGTSDVVDINGDTGHSGAPGEQQAVTATELLREPLRNEAQAVEIIPSADTSVATPNAVMNTQTASDSGNNPALSGVLIQVDPIEHPRRCVSVGPFLNLRQASEAASLLTRSGLSTSQRVEEAAVWVGHWVHLPPYPTRAAAIEVVERLRKEGVKDIYIEPSGDLQNSVSLGLFSDIERAEIRAGQVRKLGVRPQIQDRRREGLVYWVDAQIDAGFDVDINTFDTLPMQNLRRIVIPCTDDKAGLG